jgi:hypothetical protein
MHSDPAGTQLRSTQEAYAHASTVAEQLTRHTGHANLHWSLRIENDAGEKQFEVLFAELEPALASLPLEARTLMIDMCRNIAAAMDARGAAPAAGTSAPCPRGRPRLVYSRP